MRILLYQVNIFTAKRNELLISFIKAIRIRTHVLILIVYYLNSGQLLLASPSNKIEQRFNYAERLLESFKNDSANIILTNLIEELSQTNQLNTELGLKIQMRQAEALEKKDQDEEAIEKLLKLSDLSDAAQQWDVLAEVQLSLARLYEKLGLWQTCKENLEEARTTILQHTLDSIYPRFSIRIASYHRLNNNRDSALFYASEVVRTAPEFGQYEHEATGHLLIGLIWGKTAYDKALYHYKKAGARWLEVEDYSGYSFIMANLSRLHLRYNKLNLALLYNDSTLIAMRRAIEFKQLKSSGIFNYYQYRSQIYEAMGRLDSAIVYLRKGFELEQQFVAEFNQTKIVEIEKQYQDEKKAQQIENQAIQLKQERAGRIRLLQLLCLTASFSALLAYLYFRLRKANQKTKAQALEITQTNKDLAVSLEQQIMLQGEVHHRVKNNLQVLISLLDLQKKEITDPKAKTSLEAMSNRIYSMAAIHAILHKGEHHKLINLSEYTENICNHFAALTPPEYKVIFNLDMKKQVFNLETLMPIGMLLNELLTNSFKYAMYPSQPLKISIALSPKEQGYLIYYKDNGPGFPSGTLKVQDGSLGSYLLTSLTRQLQGKIETFNENGAVTKIYFLEKQTNP